VHAQVNGEDCDVSLNGVATVGDLLEQLEVYVPPRDVVVGVRINGDECGGGSTPELRALPLEGIEAIELQSASPETFAGDARARIGEYVVMIRSRFERAVENFDRGVEVDALDYYRVGLEELRLLVTLWDRLKHIDGMAGEAAGEVKVDLQRVCDALLSAQERDDLAGVRSLLATEMLPLLGRSWGLGGEGGQDTDSGVSEEPT
jgi:hypothetical protein